MAQDRGLLDEEKQHTKNQQNKALIKPLSINPINWDQSVLDATTLDNEILLEDFCKIIDIDSVTRPPEAREDALEFKHDVQRFFKKNFTSQQDKEPNAALLNLKNIMYAMILLADKGHSEPLKSKLLRDEKGTIKKNAKGIPLKKAYTGHFKIHIASPKLNDTSHSGEYRGQNGIHIRKYFKGEAPFSTALHEAVHLLSLLMYKKLMPEPREDWAALASEINIALNVYKDEKFMLPESYTHLDYFDVQSYKRKQPDAEKKVHTIEIIPHLINFIVENNKLPEISDGVLNSKIIKKIRDLLEIFYNHLSHFSLAHLVRINKQYPVGRFELYNYLETDNIDEFCKYIEQKTCRQYNLYPLHYNALKNNIKSLEIYLDKGFTVDSIDKFGNTALHVALFNKNYEAAYLLIRHGADLDKRCELGINSRELIEKDPEFLKYITLKETSALGNYTIFASMNSSSNLTSTAANEILPLAANNH